MIELQGELASSNAENAAELRNGKILGKIQYSDSPQLVIGNSQLDGKRVKLAAPYAILKKIKRDDGAVQLTNLGMVTEKYVFKTRPKPQSSSSSAD